MAAIHALDQQRIRKGSPRFFHELAASLVLSWSELRRFAYHQL